MLLTRREACKKYNIAESTLWYWLRIKKLKKYKKPGNNRVYVEEEEVARLTTPVLDPPPTEEKEASE